MRNTERTIILAGAFLLLAGCGAKKEQAAAPDAAAVPVEAAKVERATIHQVVEAEAILFAVNQANVTAKISAPVKKFYVNRGDHVKAGQLLAELENRDLAASVAENKQLVAQSQAAYQTATGAQMPEDLIKAQTDVSSLQQTVDAARKVYENRQDLQRQGALAQKLVDDAKVTLAQTQSQLEIARQHLKSLQTVGRVEQVKGLQAQVDAAKARYDNVAVQLSYAEIRSPIAGVISDRPLYAGEMAQSGTPIISVVEISQVIARANVPVREAAAIQVGRAASIKWGGGEVTGKVTVVSPAVDPNTTTVEIWVQAPNPGEKLKPGITVKVSIEAQTINNALVAPAAALLNFDEGGDKVMVVGADSLVHERKVEVGAREGDKVQILSGVKEGEQVVTVGGLGLDDKMKVTLGKPGAEDASDTKASGADEGKKK